MGAEVGFCIVVALWVLNETLLCFPLRFVRLPDPVPESDEDGPVIVGDDTIVLPEGRVLQK